MPIHDWTRVTAEAFRAFHTAWIVQLQEMLNAGVPGQPLTLVSYEADRPPVAHLEPIGVGAALPDMPLFLSAGRYVEVPLEASYLAAWRGMPERWRRELEAV